MNSFVIKTSDRLPVLRSFLEDSNGYVDLTGATVQFVYQRRTRTGQPVTGSATIISALSGLVEYAWTTGDVTGAGVFYGEWRTSLLGGKQLTFPSDSYMNFEFIDRLGL